MQCSNTNILFKLFNMENTYRGSYEQMARQAEDNHEWGLAEYYWICCGRHQDAKACKTIYEAIQLGDDFRKLNIGLQEQLESHKINIYQYMGELNKNHEKVYGNKGG